MKIRIIYLFEVLIIFLSPLSLTCLHADSLQIESILPSALYTYIERENLRVYVNERYEGLQNRQRRVYVGESVEDDEIYHKGNVYILKNMTRGTVKISQPIDSSYEVKCIIDKSGVRSLDANPLPMRTAFPVLPEETLEIGDTWNADGNDVLITTEFGTLSTPFHCSYTYKGESNVLEKNAQIIAFQYTYYDNSPYMKETYEVRGRGEGEIALFINESDGFFIKERLIRHFINQSGKVEQREEGFRLTWGRGISRGQIEALEKKVTDLLQLTEEKEEEKQPGVDNSVGAGEKAANSRTERDGGIEVERTSEGIKLNLPAIHFYPDESRILPVEEQRLDRLAEILSEIPGAEFMVMGHTADVGSRESQYTLSVERAKTIIDELVKRGLEPERFFYQGKGGDEPVGSNETEDGREMNRRVEVIILVSSLK